MCGPLHRTQAPCWKLPSPWPAQRHQQPARQGHLSSFSLPLPTPFPQIVLQSKAQSTKPAPPIMQKGSLEVLVRRAGLTQNTDDAETNMRAEKPQTISEYTKWLRDCHGVRRTSLSRARYESVADKIRKDFDKSTPWITIRDTAKHLEQKYYLATGYQLFTTTSAPELQVKPFDSFLPKRFARTSCRTPTGQMSRRVDGIFLIAGTIA